MSYESQLQFCILHGYPTVQKAVKELGSTEYRKLFNKFLKDEIINNQIMTEKFKKDIDRLEVKTKRYEGEKALVEYQKKSVQNANTRKQKNREYQKKVNAEKRKNGWKYKRKNVITPKPKKGIIMSEINPKYTIYPDGRIYTDYYNRFLSPHEYKRALKVKKVFKPHYAVSLTNIHKTTKKKLTTYQMSRLMMFYFGEHSYKTIEDMPNIVFDDEDTTNWEIGNLRFEMPGELVKRASKYKPSDFNSKIKDSDLDEVKRLLSLYKISITKRIAQRFNCSPTAVHRFKKKHNI